MLYLLPLSSSSNLPPATRGLPQAKKHIQTPGKKKFKLTVFPWNFFGASRWMLIFRRTRHRLEDCGPQYLQKRVQQSWGHSKVFSQTLSIPYLKAALLAAAVLLLLLIYALNAILAAFIFLIELASCHQRSSTSKETYSNTWYNKFQVYFFLVNIFGGI